jgi:hypothetical protein
MLKYMLRNKVAEENNKEYSKECTNDAFNEYMFCLFFLCEWKYLFTEHFIDVAWVCVNWILGINHTDGQLNVFTHLIHGSKRF